LPYMFRQRSAAIFGLFTAAVGIALVTIVGSFYQSQMNDRSEILAKNLANLAAHQVLEGMVKHDLVSLQAVLAFFTQQNQVTRATIHDLDNTLLVQARSQNARQGTANRTDKDRNRDGNRERSGNRDREWSVSSPITLQDSVAGYVTITFIADSSLDFPLTQYFILILCFSLVGFVIGGLWGGKLSKQVKAVGTVVAAGKSIHDDAGPPPQTEPSIFSATFYCSNIEQLYHQLNSQRFESIFNRFQQLLRNVTSLYDGELKGVEAQASIWEIQFSGDKDETLFKAICGGLRKNFSLIYV